MAPYLDPLSAALAKQFAAQPPIENLSVEEFRAVFDTLQNVETPITGVTRTSFTVPFEGGVKVFVFKADDLVDAEKLGVVLYLHGGGFIAGNVKSFDSICRDLALQTRQAVVFVEYTLAPEAKWPTQQEQCYAVLKWVKQNGAKKGLDGHRVAVVGDSAGGQLSVATTILASTRSPKIPIRYQVLLHPLVDTRLSDRETPSEVQFFDGPLLTVPFIKKSIALYIPSADDRDSELATPLTISAAHAKLQPPTLIVNSAVDPLKSEGNAYGEILQLNGVDCAVITTHGQVHDSEVIEATRRGPTPRAIVRMVAGLVVEALEEKAVEARKRKVEDKKETNGNGEAATRKKRRTRS
ncbi:alpha/beta hydrolase fold-domain-containing protein [Phaeosphaeria sp. MPI-PUGE-AT-0046c]|nr:alpha/beta hydrolase fold-domain-containing protein [Phaeosphaeria sp. MPI-PUGE-AT-0046c]